MSTGVHWCPQLRYQSTMRHLTVWVTLVTTIGVTLVQGVQISVVKYWSTAVSQGGTAKLACKANNDAQIRHKLILCQQAFEIYVLFSANVNGPIKEEALSTLQTEEPPAETMR